MQSNPVRRSVATVFKRRGHIVVALLGMLILVGVAPLATVSWKLIQSNREALTTSQQEIQLLLVSSMAHEVDLHVEGLSSQLLRVAQTLGAAVHRRGSVPREEIQRVLDEVVDERIGHLRYSYFEGDNVRSLAAGEHPDFLEAVFPKTLTRLAEIHAKRTDPDQPVDTVPSDPFLVDGERPLMVIAAPVVARGSFRGGLTAVVDLQTVWNAVTRRNHTGHLVFAVDELGTVFASSNPQKVHPGTDMSRDPLVERFVSGRRLVARNSIPFDIEKNGERQSFIGSFERTQQGWGIFVQAHNEEIYWTVGYMERFTLSWTLALLGLAVLAAIFFARSLSNPVNRLAAASRELAAGNLSTRVQVRSRNELGELAHAFNSMAGEIESYVHRLRMAFDENNELFLGTIRALAQAIDAKDPYTKGHSVRVNRYTMIIAKQLGMPDAELRDMYVSSLLHDVGKIGIDDAILKKAGRLTDEEFDIIKTHTTKGAEIMAQIPQMKAIIPGLRWHHERCDGSGYPDGLFRDAIPMMARIIAVADSFDAITTNRPYQSCMTFEAARNRINELRGHALDTDVVEAFNRACAAGEIRLENEQESKSSAIPAPPAAEQVLVAPEPVEV